MWKHAAFFRYFKSALDFSTIFFNVYYYCGIFSLCFWAIVPIFNYFQGFPMQLPLPTWYDHFTIAVLECIVNRNEWLSFPLFRFPYADRYWTVFWFLYIYSIFVTVFGVKYVVSMCSFEFTCFCYLNACIQALSTRLTKMGANTGSLEKSPRRRDKLSIAYEDIGHSLKYHLLMKR